jgi:hypothetical protein
LSTARQVFPSPCGRCLPVRPVTRRDRIRRASRERYSQPVMRVEQEIAEALA